LNKKEKANLIGEQTVGFMDELLPREHLELTIQTTGGICVQQHLIGAPEYFGTSCGDGVFS
jgi:hypothetical protein